MRGANYILTIAFIELIRNPHYPLYARLNLLSYIFDWVKASVRQNKKLKEIEDQLIDLREAYEPILEDQEFSKVKRSEFEKAMDLVRYDIVKLVVDNELLDESMISEIYMEGGRRR